MAIVQPAITGDVVQDSWAIQVTRALNSATLTGSGGGGIGGTGSGTGPAGTDGFNTATLYLFARSATEDSPPAAVAVDTVYVYGSGILRDPATGQTGDPTMDDDAISTDWYRVIPDDSLGEYIWTTIVHIADQGDAEDIAASTWSNVSLLSRPGQDAVTVFVEARTPDDSSADWASLSNTSNASPNFKNDTSRVIGLVIYLYEAGTEVANSVYIDPATTYTWTKNGETFTPEEMQVDGVTGIDKRVVLINEMDVADGNFNEVFTCVIDY